MKLVALKDALLLFVSQWMGTTAPRLLAAFAGLLLVALFVQALWDKRTRAVTAVVGILAGMALIAMAVDTRVLHALAGLSGDARLRLTVAALSALVLGITFEAIRRAHLQERYALLWMGAGSLTLVGAAFPKTLSVVGLAFGADYTTSILAVLFVFLVLVAFHLSLALSRGNQRESQLAQKCALLEERIERLERSVGTPVPRPASATSPAAPRVAVAAAPHTQNHAGARMAALAIILAAGTATLVAGWLTPAPMIGDEVTHFYMLQRQANHLLEPNFIAEIPMGGGGAVEVRRYPHVFGWHYLGAWVYRLTGQSLGALQLWHTLFWLQLLLVAYLLARDRDRGRRYAPVLYVLILASLPAAIIFSVAFYQDVPVAAQALTAFYFLLRGKRWRALLFLLLAMAIKETAFLFVPAFALRWGWAVWEERRHAAAARWHAPAAAAASLALLAVILAVYALAWGAVLKRYGQSSFYPLDALQQTWEAWRAPAVHAAAAPGAPSTGTARTPPLVVTSYEAEIIANHPGDLRLPRNYFIYGGVLLWLVALAGGCAAASHRWRRPADRAAPSGWLWAIGLSYTIPAAYVLRTAPDARFFLPGIPFLLLPLVEWAVRLPRIKWWLALLTALATLQAGHVYAKVYHLRRVDPALREAIAFLAAHPPQPSRIFMYPEGNYRYFTVPHEWYLAYKLREFWRGDNDLRLRMLNDHHVGAIVIKKALVANADAGFTNLGIYPAAFVRDVTADPRFEKVFENRAVLILRVPHPNP